MAEQIHAVDPDKQFDDSIRWLVDGVELLVDRKQSS